MLRKVAVLLIFIYLIPNLGLGVNLHWCGKHLASFSINSCDDLGCSCEEFEELENTFSDEDDCCKEEFAFLKLNTTHVAGKELLQIGAKSVLLLVEPLSDPSVDPHRQLFSVFELQSGAIVADPPDQSLLCVFRV